MSIRIKKGAVIFISVFLAICVLLAIYVFVINAIVVNSSSTRILEPDDVVDEYDCILVLGCGVVGDRPSDRLEDRLLVAIDLYERGVAPKLLMSGDHGQVDYDEVSVMRSFAIEKGVPSEDIFMDHAGFSTYESVVRAKEIFGVEKMAVVTQEYHLYRALYISRSFGIDAVGIAADLRPYSKVLYHQFREFAARNKDFIFCIFKPEPTYLGEEVSLGGDGNVTLG